MLLKSGLADCRERCQEPGMHRGCGAKNWNVLCGKLGFESSRLHAGVYHQPKQVMLVAHVDDRFCRGQSECLDWVSTVLQQRYDIKEWSTTKSSAGADGCAPQRAGTSGPPTRSTQIFCWTSGARRNRTVLPSVPTTSEVKSTEEMPPMTLADTKKFRIAAARFNYNSESSVEVNGTTKRERRQENKEGLKVLAKTANAHIALLVPTDLIVTMDSDWPGCKRTRRSASGILPRHGTQVLLFASRFQRNVVLSAM